MSSNQLNEAKFSPLKKSQTEDASDSRVQMKRELTLLNAVSLIVGSIIGSGIFVSPGGVLQYVNSGGLALLIWALCGMLCMAGALCFSELGTMLPSSGGEYTYILYAFGNLPAFLTIWVNVLMIRPGSQAVVALAFAEYSLSLTFPNCKAPKIAVILLAASALILLTFINCASVRLAMRIQTVFTSGKLIALVAIILAGLLHLAKGRENNLNASFSESVDVGGVSMAFYSGLFAYGGWNYVNFVTEELQDPYRDLPRSIWIAMPLVTIIYVLANIAYLAVLTPEQIISSQAVAVLFGQKALGPLQYTVPIFVALSTFGSLNGILFTSGRLFLTGARNGHLPPFLSFIHIKARTPLPALLLNCLISFLMIGFGILFLINCLSFVLWLSIGTATSALLWLRYREPELHRPIKVNLVLPIIFSICCIFLVVFPMFTEPKSTGLAILLTLIGIPIYAIGILMKKSKFLVQNYKSCEIWMQKLLLVIPPGVIQEVEKPTGK